MKLPKALLGAMLVGLAVQTTGCGNKGNDPKPKGEQAGKPSKKTPDNCPACGMG